MSEYLSSTQKLILVIGATGAQGQAVINALLEPCADGSASPYAIRALTRNVNHQRAQNLAAKGVECVQGSVDDLSSIAAALRGCYGVWVNVDGFTVGEQKEIYAGIRIFELSKQTHSLRHYVWSSLDYGLKKGNYNETYRCDHYDAKGRVAEWIHVQYSEPSDDGMSWSIVTTGPYMDMMHNMMFGPLRKRDDGTYVFALPIGEGHIPMIALSDLGFFARYTFDNRTVTSGQELEVASDIVDREYLVSTFRKVTGEDAVFVDQTLDEWFANFEGVDNPVANERPEPDGSTTWRENFTGWWALWRDDLITRDLDWVRSVNPHCRTLESWMRENDYKGQWKRTLLKNSEDGKNIGPKWDVLSQL